MDEPKVRKARPITIQKIVLSVFAVLIGVPVIYALVDGSFRNVVANIATARFLALMNDLNQKQEAPTDAGQAQAPPSTRELELSAIQAGIRECPPTDSAKWWYERLLTPDELKAARDEWSKK